MMKNCQRWHTGRDVYRPQGEPINPMQYEVAPMGQDTEAKAFVKTHHYLASYPAARFRFGLWKKNILSGTAVFSVPCNQKVLTSVFPCEPRAAAELGRFVLLDEVPGNGETWFLARCFELLRKEGLEGLVSFSDPVARTNQNGDRVFPGHYGGIYQAHNAIYLGRGTPRTLHLLPDGTVFSDRAASKIRKQERGWKYAVAQLVRWGASPLLERDEPSKWLRRWVSAVTRRLRHPGNHKYAWALNRRLRRFLPAGKPYPKGLAS